MLSAWFSAPQTVEAHFKAEAGYPADAKVIYGDTDSVMVRFGVREIEKAVALGKEFHCGHPGLVLIYS